MKLVYSADIKLIEQTNVSAIAVVDDDDDDAFDGPHSNRITKVRFGLSCNEGILSKDILIIIVSK